MGYRLWHKRSYCCGLTEGVLGVAFGLLTAACERARPSHHAIHAFQFLHNSAKSYPRG